MSSTRTGTGALGTALDAALLRRVLDGRHHRPRQEIRADHDAPWLR